MSAMRSGRMCWAISATCSGRPQPAPRCCFISTTGKASRRRCVRRPNGNRPQRGLNENYARELMELHTLGVDGGYTQKDVTEVARCFTGWTIRNPQQGGGFTFNERVHDKGEKLVLGVRIPAGGGREDAEKVLDILANHPSTAKFISTKLAQRFVADNPPPALIDRMAKTFQRTRRRYSRSDEDDAHVEGILLRRERITRRSRRRLK